MPKVVFTSEEIIAACEAAKAAGDTAYTSVFSLATAGRTAGNGAVRYFDLSARAGGKEGRLNLRFRKERHVGQILPLVESDATPAGPVPRGGPGERPRTRDPARTPSLGIQKYSVPVSMSEGGEVVVSGGGPPPDEARSPYFQAIECLDVFFQAEMERLMGAGKIITKSSKGPRAADAMLVGNSTVIRLYQDAVSHSAATDAGMALPNPITRISMKFDETSGFPRKGTEYYDFDRQYPNPKDRSRFLCEELKFDGEPLSVKNVHNIRGGSEISGIAGLTAMCVSNMGISIPITLECLYLRLSAPLKFSMDDIFDEHDFRAEKETRAEEAHGCCASALEGDAPQAPAEAGARGDGPPAAALPGAALDEIAGGLEK